jgi:flagellar hook assembly protein FlgD
MMRSAASPILLALLLGTVYPHQACCHELYPNDPDPFCPASGPTEIGYRIDSPCHVYLDVQDYFGKRVDRLSDFYCEGGERTETWDGRAELFGDTLRTGHFSFVLDAGGEFYEEDCTTYCGNDLAGPWRLQEVCPIDLAVAFAVGLEASQPVELVFLEDDSVTVVRTVSFDHVGPGVSTVEWDLRDDFGEPVPQGRYICRLGVPDYSEDIAFRIFRDVAPAALQVTLRDKHGVLHVGSPDALSPPIVETPILEGWFDFGRSMAWEEVLCLFDASTGFGSNGSLEHVEFDSAEFAPDFSSLHVHSFSPDGDYYHWDDPWGLGWYGVGLPWIQPDSVYFHLKHSFQGITFTDEECTITGYVDSLDWGCSEGGWPPGPALGGPCPNPADYGGTVIRFSTKMALSTWVTLLLINTDGYLVKTVLDTAMPAGQFMITWAADDESGAPVPEGIYHLICEMDSVFFCSGDIEITSDITEVGNGRTRVLDDGPSILCYPSPFRSGNPARIVYRVEEEGPVDLAIYDVAGRRVRKILSSAVIPAGQYHDVWDGRDNDGHPVASGVYFVQYRQGAKVEVRRLTFVK